MGAVCRLLADSVLGWYTRRLSPSAPRKARGGAVLVLQRTSADLKLNSHIHAIFLDGIFVPGPGPAAPPVFRPLPRLRTDEVADLLQVIRVRVLSFLVRHGVITASEEATILPGPLAERDPALVQLAAAAVSGLPPAGPERRRKPILIPLPPVIPA